MTWLSVLLCCFCSSAKTELHGKVLVHQLVSAVASKAPNRLKLTRAAGDRLAQATPIIRQGQEISLNGQTFPVAWSQWQAGASVRTGISDTGAMKVLGLELLSTNNSSVQPVQWFSDSTQPFFLQARYLSPYRYLDITELVQGEQLQVVGDTLSINTVPAQILSIREGKQDWGQRIVIDLNRPTVWQVSQAQGEGVVTLEGTASEPLLRQFQPPEEDGERKSQALVTLENSGTKTKLAIELPEAKNLQVFSLSDPHRLVIDVRSQTLVERNILWAPGVRWRQQVVSIDSPTEGSSEPKQFPVVWLEVDIRSPNISLKPITSRADTQVGIAPLIDTAQLSQAAAAINGGFFNRNNQLPLGAIRRDSRWLSGPILNRGAIAWGNGTVEIGRLRLQEIITTSTGDRLPVLFLNSGYVKAGLARYTKEWGETYSSLTDGETIVFVQNEQIVQLQADAAKNTSFAIPADGYLLVIRADDIPRAALQENTAIELQNATFPADFAAYPQILGAGPLLVQNQQIVLDAAAEHFSPAFNRQAASRSAIGVAKPGTLMIAAVHAGNVGSPTLEELALIMQRLGATDALNLDGGSSTALYLGGQLIDRPQGSAARVHNGFGIFVR